MYAMSCRCKREPQQQKPLSVRTQMDVLLPLNASFGRLQFYFLTGTNRLPSCTIDSLKLTRHLQ